MVEGKYPSRPAGCPCSAEMEHLSQRHRGQRLLIESDPAGWGRPRGCGL